MPANGHHRPRFTNGHSSSTDSERTPLTAPAHHDKRSPSSRRDRLLSTLTIGTSLVAVVIGAKLLTSTLWNAWQRAHAQPSEQPLYDDLGRYILRDYDAQPPFSDFLPALAGYYGKPLWAFYVNRGQGLASFGTESKEYPILEFQSANKAYQTTALTGFRTFVQGKRKRREFLVEPFSAATTRWTTKEDDDDLQPIRTMNVGSNEMQIQEVDPLNQLETNVTYFVLPEEDFGAFGRRTTITNTDPHSRVTISVLDGLAKIEPAGGKLNEPLKMMGRTLEGWMGVYSPYNDTLEMPFYRLSMQPTDKAAVVVQEEGHWVLSVMENHPSTLMPIVYDTSKIFGEDTTLLNPVQLHKKSISDILREPQYAFAKTSSAFGVLEDITLAPGESVTLSTFFGKAAHMLHVPIIARRLLQPGFVPYKMSRSREVIRQITAGVETKTSSPLLDAHVQQMFLDNALRGGIPSVLGEVDDDARMRNMDEDERLKVLHLFSRKHGDLERDYNAFLIEATFFSAGPGNFRDVAQNRRNDVLFTPRIGSFNLRTFLSLVQADGYNPLTVESVVFVIEDLNVCQDIAKRAVGQADGHRAQREALTGILNEGPFRPGQLFLLIEEQHIELIMSRQEFIDMVAAAATYSP